MSESSEWSELSVSELKDSLRERGMPVSGRKEDLVRRLEENSVFQAEIADIPSDKGFRKLLDRIRAVSYTHLTLPTILLV